MNKPTCQQCGKEQKTKLCHINFMFRSPKKVYKDSQRPFIRTENRALCFKCFAEMEKKIRKIIM